VWPASVLSGTAVPTASAAGHRGKSRIYPDEGVFMSLGWLTFVE
jgi:hypothetical protein